MPLSSRERLTMLMPPSVFYRQHIAQEARTGEPELAVLAELVPRGGIAVDEIPWRILFLLRATLISGLRNFLRASQSAEQRLAPAR